MKVIHPDGNTSTIDSFSFDSATSILRLQGAGVVQPDPDPQPEPEPDPEYPQPEPHVPDNVIEHYHFDPMKGASNQQILVPPSNIISSRFTAPAKGYGSISFEFDPTVHGYKTVRAWISTTPGGAPVKGSEKENAMMITVSWTLADHRTKAVLTPGGKYYLNVQHAKAEDKESRLFRYISPGTKI